LIEELRAVVADIEDEPDGEEAQNAIAVGLKKIANDVAVEQSHERVLHLSIAA
jgi:hypothetical protein